MSVLEDNDELKEREAQLAMTLDKIYPYLSDRILLRLFKLIDGPQKLNVHLKEMCLLINNEIILIECDMGLDDSVCALNPLVRQLIIEKKEDTVTDKQKKFYVDLGVIRAVAKNKNGLMQVTAYEKPIDYPHNYVLRASIATRGGLLRTTAAYFGETKEEIFEVMEEAEFYFISRHPNDEPHILGIWF